MLLNPRKRSRRSGGRRRGSRRSYAAGVVGSVKQVFSKDLVMTGLGLFAGATATSIVWQKYGPKKTGTDSTGKDVYESTLPLATTTLGPLLYGVGIPAILGMFVRRWSPALGNGVYLSAVNSLIQAYVAPAVDSTVKQLAGTSAYIRSTGSYLPAANGRNLLTSPVGNFPGQRPLFPTTAFGKR